MPACTRSAVAMLTDFFASDDIEATARRTGFVQRTSKMTGKLFLALVTFGVWSEAKTTLVQLAAKVTQLGQHVDVSPEAIHQRMNKKAIAFLQDMIRQALAKVQSLEHVCDDGLFPAFTKVYIADSTGFGLPEELHKTFPGAGGSAAKAGAKIQAVWDYKSGVFGHFALTPWNIPDQRYIDQVVALAYKGVLFIFDLGYFKVKALASIATAGAYFFCRLNHQTNLYETVAGRLCPVKLAGFLTTGEHEIPLLEKAISIGAKECVASRLIAVRMPEAIVNERRRIARKKAKKKGYTPSPSHLELLAWNLFITNVPHTIWKTETVVNVYPLRWQIELIFKSWKSYLHLASITTKKEDSTLCYLYGRMLLILFNYALCPQMRATLWLKKKRELSLLKLVRHFQALAERWMQAIFQSAIELRRFLQRACATAERLGVKASRKRRTTAQILRESLQKQVEAVAFTEAVNA
jgi:Transposase DDE domain